MQRSELLEKFKAAASEIAEKEFDDLQEDSVIVDLGLDSLVVLEVIGELEQAFDVRIPDDKLVGIQTVSQLLDIIEEQL
ncbi:MAG: acyl carrier protein [Sandaracinaceae bacterium]|nr:acyl carrier protein [Sandaracinaceae bacterium]